ncbi:DNA-directed RNA polymerase subunit D [Candidatus Woesearchaeota archaeon CG_4_10_14_0_2_um_filter_33_13]|nr:MAG: DNA-directed RNA polymerase subunit D [Candidatus Woesearchaeota archaeon CG_4_10_14_0_2_um_filter_33_13]
MKLEKLKEEKKKGKITFLLKDSDEVFANTIRRLVMEEVPVLAVEDLEIKDNNSALYDEMVGLRLGLCPIKTDLKSYELKENCKCGGEGCARCELKITLKSGKNGYVYCEDAVSTDPKCTFAYPKMPIVKLLPKQKVEMTLTAVLGKGKDHAKWIPGLAFYKREVNIKVGKVANPEQIVQQCPAPGIFSVKGNKLEVNSDKVHDCQICQKCVELDENISLEETGNFIFSLESWGQLAGKEMLHHAAEILVAKVDEMEKLL